MKLPPTWKKPAIYGYAWIKRHPGHLQVACVVFAISWLWLAIPSILSFFGSQASASRGAYGDQYGAFNALVSALAFIGMLAALSLQRKELITQRKELKLATEAAARTATAQENSNRIMADQANKDRAISMFDEWYAPEFRQHQAILRKALQVITNNWTIPLKPMSWLEENVRDVSDHNDVDFPVEGSSQPTISTLNTIKRVRRFFITWRALHIEQAIDTDLLHRLLASGSEEWRMILLAPLRLVEPHELLRETSAAIELDLFSNLMVHPSQTGFDLTYFRALIRTSVREGIEIATVFPREVPDSLLIAYADNCGFSADLDKTPEGILHISGSGPNGEYRIALIPGS